MVVVKWHERRRNNAESLHDMACENRPGKDAVSSWAEVTTCK